MLSTTTRKAQQMLDRQNDSRPCYPCLRASFSTQRTDLLAHAVDPGDGGWRDREGIVGSQRLVSGAALHAVQTHSTGRASGKRDICSDTMQCGAKRQVPFIQLQSCCMYIAMHFTIQVTHHVPQLAEDAAAPGMHGLHDWRPRLRLLPAVDSRCARHASCALADDGRLGDDQASVATGCGMRMRKNRLILPVSGYLWLARRGPGWFDNLVSLQVSCQRLNCIRMHCCYLYCAPP